MRGSHRELALCARGEELLEEENFEGNFGVKENMYPRESQEMLQRNESVFSL